MANKNIQIRTSLGETISVLMVDNGDGTHSLSTAGASGGEAVSIADGASISLGAKADVRATWYDAVGSLIAHLKLAVAALVDAGSHAYGYNGSGQLVTDAWTLFGTTRTKTYTWVASNMTAETDWA